MKRILIVARILAFSFAATTACMWLLITAADGQSASLWFMEWERNARMLFALIFIMFASMGICFSILDKRY